MKNGLVLLTDPDYPADKARALADEGFRVQICTHPRDLNAAIMRHFPRWIVTPRVVQKCGCGKK